jgi:hypothetical protein
VDEEKAGIDESSRARLATQSVLLGEVALNKQVIEDMKEAETQTIAGI